MLACALFALALCTSNLTMNVPFVAKPLQRFVTASNARMFENPVQHIVKQPLWAVPEVTPNVFAASLETPPPHEKGALANVHLNSNLLKAVSRANESEVRTLLADGADVHAVDAEGRTPLLTIANHGRSETAQHLKITALLLEHGAKVDATDEHGHTPLMLAAKWGRMGTVKLLRQHGAEVNAASDYGHTPLILAAGNGHVDVVEFLLEHEAEVNAFSRHGYTAFMYAVWRKHLQVATILLQHGADVEAVKEDKGSALLVMIKKPSMERIAKMLFLEHEIKGGKVHVGNKLFNQLSLMHKASHLESKKESIEFLLDLGADTEAKSLGGWTALMHATSYKNFEVVDLLLKHGAKVDEDDIKGRTALWWAVSEENLDIAKLLLKNGADVNATNIFARSMLTMVKEERGSLAVIELLQKHGAKE